MQDETLTVSHSKRLIEFLIGFIPACVSLANQFVALGWDSIGRFSRGERGRVDSWAPCCLFGSANVPGVRARNHDFTLVLSCHLNYIVIKIFYDWHESE